MVDLVQSFYRNLEVEKAVSLGEKALVQAEASLKNDDPLKLELMTVLAGVYMDAGKSEQSIKLGKSALEISETQYGSDHPQTLRVMSMLVESLRVSPEHKQAVLYGKKHLMLTKAKLGVSHIETINSMSRLALIYQTNEEFTLASKQFEELNAILKNKLGVNHPAYLSSTARTATCYSRAGNTDKAIVLNNLVFERIKPELENQHTNQLAVLSDLAHSCKLAKQTDLEIRLHEAMLGTCKVKLGETNLDTIDEMIILGKLLIGKNNARAVDLLSRGYELNCQVQPTHWYTFVSQSVLGESLLKKGNYQLAKKHLNESYRQLKVAPERSAKFFLKEAAERLVKLAEATEDKEELAKWIAEKKILENEEQKYLTSGDDDE